MHSLSHHGIGLLLHNEMISVCITIFHQSIVVVHFYLCRLIHETLQISGTWHTSYPKLDALNAFIACGILYVINYDTLHINYVYDMKSETESYVSDFDLN